MRELFFGTMCYLRFFAVWLALLSFRWLFAQERPFTHLLNQASEIKVNFPIVEQQQLDNGIVVYMIPHSLVPQASFKLIALGGSVDEPADKTGLSSLAVEMMVFSGSTNMPREQLAEFFETRATRFSGNCSLERCSFQLSSLAHFFLKDLATAIEVILNPRFASADWEIIKKRTLQAIEQRGETPSSLVSLVLKTRTYPHSLRSKILTKQSLAKIEITDFIALHQKLLEPARLSIALAGDFDKKAVLLLLNQTLGQLKTKQNSYNPAALEKLPAMPAGKVFRVEKDIPQSSLVLRAPGLKHNDHRYTAWRLFDSILGGDSFNSVLTQNIRTKNGWAYSVYSSFDSDLYQGSITIAAQTENKNLPNVIAEIHRTLQNTDEYLTQERLAQAKEAMLNKYVFLYETPEQFLNLYLSLLWDNMPANYLQELPEKIKAVTLAEVKAIARELYAKEKFFTVIVGPKWAYESELGNTEYILESEFK